MGKRVGEKEEGVGRAVLKLAQRGAGPLSNGQAVLLARSTVAIGAGAAAAAPRAHLRHHELLPLLIGGRHLHQPHRALPLALARHLVTA